MRLLPVVLLSLIASWTASGQTYTISTFAGGGLPVNLPGTSASLSSPLAVSVDKAGSVFFVDAEHIVLRLDVGIKAWDPSRKEGDRFVLNKFSFTGPYGTEREPVIWNVGIGYPF